MIGKVLAHYEISALLGKGGMGEVYRALDQKLGRDVALKILPRELSGDPERIARFDREARNLASLQHPNVASIYGFEEVDGVRFLTMELVEGEELAQRLVQGPIPTDEALMMALQLAVGLEAAHEKNIVHRDLKPANIKIDSDGVVKILDFGLARAYSGEVPDSEDFKNSPTITAAMTQVGAILGTAAYMSPEQARGKSVDKRTDIWAFGCVLYELLTGLQAFPGETTSDSIAGILEREPNWPALPQETPHTVRVLLRRCLEKNPLNRLRDIGDARIVIAELQSGRGGEPASEGIAEGRAAGGHRSAWLFLGLTAGFAVAALAGWLFLPATDGPQLPVRRYLVAAPGLTKNWVQRPAISPDGRRLVFVANDHLWVQELDELNPKRLEGTDDARAPFWSHDSESLAFGRDGELRRIEVDGGSSRLLCDIPGSPRLYSGDWNQDDVIVFAVDHGPIYEISAQGGDPRVRLALDAEREVDFHSIRFLPDGETLLAQPHLVEKGLGIESETLLLLTNDGTRKVVLTDESWGSIFYGEFAAGHIVYERRRGQKGIWAVPFSLESLETSGDPFPVALRGKDVSVASDGTLIYRRDDSTSDRVQPTLVDRGGNVIQSFGDPQHILSIFSISPDGRRAVFTVGSTEKGEGDLWIYDLQRGTSSPLTKDAGLESMPHWSPGGDQIAFVRGVHPNDFELRVIDVNDPGRQKSLGPGFRPVFSPDGKFLTYSRFVPPGTTNLWYRPVGGKEKPIEFLATESTEFDGRISPDGGWIAYVAQGARPREVFIRSFPDGEVRHQVSTDGGTTPRWSPRGDALFYANGGDVLEVSITSGETLDLGQPRQIFTREGTSAATPDGWDERWLSNLEVTPDGEGFLILQPAPTTEEDRPDEIVVMQNWLAGSSRP